MSRYTVTLPSPEMARFVAEHPAVAALAVQTAGCTVLLTGEALRALAAVPADHDGHYDGEHLWIGGTEYDVAEIGGLAPGKIRPGDEVFMPRVKQWRTVGQVIEPGVVVFDGDFPRVTLSEPEYSVLRPNGEGGWDGWLSTAENPALTLKLTEPITVEAADIIEATGADWLPCGCLGTQPEHTCGPRETADTDDEREAERAGWQSTAEVLADPELTAALTDPIEEDHGPVPPPLPPVMLTATFTLTVTVQRDRWAGLDGPAEDDPEGDFWGYVADGSGFAEHLRDGMAALRDADGTVTVTPVARTVARGPEYPTVAEPPVGTILYRGGSPVWTHRADGWYCATTPGECHNCPCGWDEVWDIGGVRGADVCAEPPR